MTAVPQTRSVLDQGVRLGVDPAQKAIHGLSETVELGSNMPAESGPDVALQTVYFGMAGPLPACVIRIHNMARIAETGLLRNGDESSGGCQQNKDQQHGNLLRRTYRPQLTDNRAKSRHVLSLKESPEFYSRTNVTLWTFTKKVRHSPI